MFMTPFQKEPTPNFSNETFQKAFVHDAKSANSLIQKELSVNQAEQNLLEQRIRMMKEFINDLPSSDPQYSMMLTSIQMDQIELDELKIRASTLISQIQ